MPKATNFFFCCFTLLGCRCCLLACCKHANKEVRAAGRWSREKKKQNGEVEKAGIWMNSFGKMVNYISSILSIFSIIFLNYNGSYYKKNLLTVKKKTVTGNIFSAWQQYFDARFHYFSLWPNIREGDIFEGLGNWRLYGLWVISFLEIHISSIFIRTLKSTIVTW